MQDNTIQNNTIYRKARQCDANQGHAIQPNTRKYNKLQDNAT